MHLTSHLIASRDEPNSVQRTNRILHIPYNNTETMFATKLSITLYFIYFLKQVHKGDTSNKTVPCDDMFVVSKCINRIRHVRFTICLLFKFDAESSKSKSKRIRGKTESQPPFESFVLR